MSHGSTREEKALRPHPWRERWGAVVLLAIGVAVLLTRESPALAFVLNRLAELGRASAVVLLLVAVWGWLGFLLTGAHTSREISRTASFVMGGVCAASLTSVAFLIAGWSGVLTRGVAWGGVVLLAGAALALAWKRKGGWERVPGTKPESEPWGPKHVALIVLVALLMLPVVVSAFAPPLVYDVTEYHLGAIRSYLEGERLRLRPVPYNFYARFPFPVEALYFLGILLEGPTDFAPKLLNLAAVLALGALVWEWLRRWEVRRTWRLIALVALFGHPVLLEVSLDAYIDAPVALVALCSLFGLSLLAKTGEGSLSSAARWRLFPVVALLLGTLAVVKYTAAQLYLVPLLVLFARSLWGTWRCAPWRTRLLAAGCFVLPLGTWLGKNVVFYGNPLEPFFCWLFSRGDAAAVAREKFFLESHYPQPPWVLSYWTTLVPRLGAFGWLWLAPAVAVPLLGQSHEIRRLLAVAGLSYLLWNMVRYSQDRFLLATIAIVILIGVAALQALPSRLARWAGGGVLLLAALTGAVPHALRVAGGGEFDYVARMTATAPKHNAELRREFLKRNLGALGEVLAYAQSALPAGAKVLFVYEARPYLLDRAVVYNTVFDESELLRLAGAARSADEVTTLLLEAGITHVLVNVEELRRFIDQYARPQQLAERGIRDTMREFPLIADPENLYPPFYRNPAWGQMGEPIRAWLELMRKEAEFVRGQPQAPVFLTPLRKSEALGLAPPSL